MLFGSKAVVEGRVEGISRQLCQFCTRSTYRRVSDCKKECSGWDAVDIFHGASETTFFSSVWCIRVLLGSKAVVESRVAGIPRQKYRIWTRSTYRRVSDRKKECSGWDGVSIMIPRKLHFFPWVCCIRVLFGSKAMVEGQVEGIPRQICKFWTRSARFRVSDCKKKCAGETVLVSHVSSETTFFQEFAAFECCSEARQW